MSWQSDTHLLSQASSKMRTGQTGHASCGGNVVVSAVMEWWVRDRWRD